MSKILFIDTETGGLDPTKHSLLSMALCLWVDGNLIPSQEWYLKSPQYVITPEALALNKINLAKFDEVAIDKDEAIAQIVNWMSSCQVAPDDFPITVGGHNVYFDLAFLDAYYGSGYFAKSFSHRVVDTATILRFLCDAGKLPPELASGSLSKALEYFKIGDDNKRHSALTDVLDTATLYNRLIELVK